MVKDWSEAKMRYEEEIQRKKEHANFATNFEARGFVRQNYSSRYFDFKKNPLEEEDDSLSESEVEFLEESEEEEEEEKKASLPPVTQFKHRPKTAPRRIKPPLAKLIDIAASEAVKEEEDQEVVEEGKKESPQKENKKPESRPGSALPPIQSGKRKIETLRKLQGHLISATDNHMEEINSVLLSNQGVNQADQVVTLSVYNTAKMAQDKKVQPPGTRPMSAPFPDLKALSKEDFHRKVGDAMRLEQINEINQIKERLARDKVACDIATLERAVLMPEDYSFNREVKKYPNPGAGLMVRFEQYSIQYR